MDLKIIENGNGGDLVFENQDIVLISEIYNQSYLAHFGGNTENSTTDDFSDIEEHGDFWLNALILKDEPNEQFNSKLEKSLDEIELSSSGRIKLQSISTKDLEYLANFAKYTSTISIPFVDKIKVFDTFVKDDKTSFIYIWDEAKDEIIE